MAELYTTTKALSHALRAEKSQDWETAAALYSDVLERFPNNKQANQRLKTLAPQAIRTLLEQSQAAQRDGDWAKSEGPLLSAFKLAPQVVEIGCALASIQLQIDKPSAALKTATTVLAHHPSSVDAINYKGQAQRALGKIEAARATFAKAPQDASALSNLAILARAEGDKEAELFFTQKAKDLAPEDPAMHWNYANARTYQTGSKHIEEMQALLAKGQPHPPRYAPLYRAMFKALDDIGAHKDAFSFLCQANALADRASGYDFKRDALRYALNKNIFARPLPNAAEFTDPKEGLRPIFITGLPRSGTSLCERILSQDPRTRACGELGIVGQSASRLLQSITTGEQETILPQDLTRLRRQILSGLKDHSQGHPIALDKMPLNFMWIGQICAAVPEARIVHMQRDPMAVAWSLYKTGFAGTDNGFANRIENIVKIMVLHRDMMAHWRKICPDHIMDVPYDDLVNDTEATTRTMARFTGLEWSESWLTPENSKSLSLTASADQLRQPIYGGSNAAWKTYEAELAPLNEALKSVGLIP